MPRMKNFEEFNLKVSYCFSPWPFQVYTMFRSRTRPSLPRLRRALPSRVFLAPQLPKPVSLPVLQRSARTQRDFIFHITNAFSQLVANPMALLLILLITALVVTHQQDPLKGPIHSIAERLKSNKSWTWLGNLIANSEQRLIGLVILLPTAFVSKYRNKLAIIGFAAAWVCIAPPFTLYLYAAQAAALYMYTAVNDNTTRLLILVVVFALHGIWGIEDYTVKGSTTTTTTPSPRSNSKPSGKPKTQSGEPSISHTLPPFPNNGWDAPPPKINDVNHR